MSESLWSIYNRSAEVRVDGLQAFQLKAIVECFTPQSYSSWLIWQEGWVDWQDLESVITSLFPSAVERTVTMINSVPSVQLNSGVIAEQSPLTYAQVDLRLAGTQTSIRPQVPSVSSLDQFVGECPVEPAHISVDAAPAPAPIPAKQEERRKLSRVDVPITLFLQIDGGVLKNETVDVSLGGMRLKTPLSKEPKGSFDVTMVHNGVELALKCKLVSKDEKSPRAHLMIEKCNRIEILRSWIPQPAKLEAKKESA